MSGSTRDESFLRAARSKYLEQHGIVIDADADVTRVPGGAYVSASVHVKDEEVESLQSTEEEVAS